MKIKKKWNPLRWLALNFPILLLITSLTLQVVVVINSVRYSQHLNEFHERLIDSSDKIENLLDQLR